MTDAVTTEHVLVLPDGRRLAWSESGDADGSPVLCLHGTPGSRVGRHPEPERLLEAGIRQITYDRPGYGLSDPLPGRSVADVVPDVRALLDAAAVDRAGVMGGSGGGPHALAVATLLPERCTVVQCVVGVAPYDAPDLDFFEGMDPGNQQRFRMAVGDRDAVVAAFTQEVERLRALMTDDPASLMGDMDLPEADREILRRTADRARATLEEAFRQGVLGMADDFAALAR